MDMRRIGTTLTPSGTPCRGFRASSIGVPSSTGCPAPCWCCILMNFTTARRVRRRVSGIEWPTYHRGTSNRCSAGRRSPFIDGGVSRDPRLRAAIALLLQRLHARPDPLQHLDALHDLARSLVAAAGRPQTKTRPDFFAVARAREYMLDRLNQGVTLDDLASVAGTDRWQLSRDFRAVLGTSPYRFLTMRRLDRVRALLVKGAPIALAALEAGFYDQSHMVRHFASVYGSPPARWLQRLGRGPHGR